jgi:hypothetical protein
MNPMQSPNTGVGKKLCRSELHPNRKEKRPKNFDTLGRKIVVDGVTWRWNYGRSMVVAYSEFGDKITSPPETIIGVSPDEHERGNRLQAECSPQNSLPTGFVRNLFDFLVDKTKLVIQYPHNEIQED